MHCGVCNGWRRHRALLRRAYELCFHVCASFRFLLAVIFHRTFRVSGGFYVLVGFTIVMPAEMALLVLFVFVCLSVFVVACFFSFPYLLPGLKLRSIGFWVMSGHLGCRFATVNAPEALAQSVGNSAQ